ncbi:hypothetical protein E2562_003199 [Oryza meyeriana var. granulata]|uniref:Uncharacterized protein n=1 Tax=Oryza meyeriana var. granulata TaxID=110450 RepID=A0A6G1EUR3_9ORYZ|nr:hypothetical protein E2562_003199 [Oryza meyeriana var. granulata]
MARQLAGKPMDGANAISGSSSTGENLGRVRSTRRCHLPLQSALPPRPFKSLTLLLSHGELSARVSVAVVLRELASSDDWHTS